MMVQLVPPPSPVFYLYDDMKGMNIRKFEFVPFPRLAICSLILSCGAAWRQQTQAPSRPTVRGQTTYPLEFGEFLSQEIQ